MIRINTATISLIIAIIALLDSIRNNIVSFRRNRHSNTAIAIKEFANKISQFNKIINISNAPLSAKQLKSIKVQLINFIGQWSELRILSANVTIKVIKKVYLV